MVALSGTSGNLNVQCANCSGSGVSTADEATMTPGTSLFAGGGGFFQTTATSNPLTTGQQGMFQVTSTRSLFTNLRNAAGTEIGTAATPIQVSLANTTANATALLTTGTGGTFPATQSGTWNITNISGTISLPTGAATQITSAAILTALGSPFQAGGSIGNTTFAATQATAASLNATVVGTGTFAMQLTGATNNINNIAGTISLPTGAGTAANQTTINTSLGTLHTDLSSLITVAGNPLATQVGAVWIGNVGQNGAPWSVTAALNVTPSIANGNGVVPTQGGAVLSVTNGGYTNLLQANAVLAVGNPLFMTGSGTAGTAAVNPVTVQGIAGMVKLQVTPDSVALPANQSVNVNQIAGSTLVADPCEVNTPTYTPINVSASGSTKIITGTSAKKTYICHIDLVTNAANNVALIEGTVTNCGTGTAGIAGGTTAASGWNFSVNGGISLGMGRYSVNQSATNADDVCLITSAATQLSGGVKWVQQ